MEGGNASDRAKGSPSNKPHLQRVTEWTAAYSLPYTPRTSRQSQDTTLTPDEFSPSDPRWNNGFLDTLITATLACARRQQAAASCRSGTRGCLLQLRQRTLAERGAVHVQVLSRSDVGRASVCHLGGARAAA